MGVSHSQNLVPFSINGKYGFKAEQTILIQPKYEYALDFSQGLAAVKLNGKWGFIDPKGELIIPNKFKAVSGFEHGYARFQQGELIGLIDTAGNVALAPCADFIQFLETYGSDEQFELGLKGKRGLFVPSDRVIVSPKYKYVNYRRGSCIVRLENDKLGIVHNDELKIQNLVSTPYFSNKKIAKGKTDDGYGLLSNRGVWLIEPGYKGMHVEMWGAIPLVMVSNEGELSSYRQKNFQLLDKKGSLVLADTFVSFEKVYEEGFMEYDWGTEPYNEVTYVFTSKNGDKYEPFFNGNKLELRKSHRLDLKGLPASMKTFYSKGKYGLIASSDTLLPAEFDTIGTIFLSSSNSDDYMEFDEWGEPLYSYNEGRAEYLWLKKGNSIGIYHLASKKVLGGFYGGELEVSDRFVQIKNKDYEILYFNDKYFKGQKVELESFYCPKFSSNTNKLFKEKKGEVDYILANDEKQFTIYDLEGNEILSHSNYLKFHNSNILLKAGERLGTVDAYFVTRPNQTLVKDVYLINLINYNDEANLINEYGEVIYPEYESEFFYKDGKDKIGVLLSSGRHIKAKYDSINAFPGMVKMYKNGLVDYLYFMEYGNYVSGRIAYYPIQMNANQTPRFESDDYETWLYTETDTGSLCMSSTGVKTSYQESYLKAVYTERGIALKEINPETNWNSFAVEPQDYKKIVPHWNDNYHLAKVKTTEGWGVNTIGGQLIVPAKFKKLEILYDPYEEQVIHSVGSKISALYKLNGDLIYEGAFKGAEFPYFDGMALLEIQTKNGLLLIDYESGEIISPNNIKSYEPIEAMLDDSEYYGFNGLAMTDENGKSYIYKNSCFSDVCFTFKEVVKYDLDFLFFEVKEEERECIYSMSSEYYYKVFEDSKDYTIDLYGGVALMTSKTTGRYRVYDLTAGMRYEGIFDDFRDGPEGLEVFINNNWQYIFELPLEE